VNQAVEYGIAFETTGMFNIRLWLPVIQYQQIHAARLRLRLFYYL
jgi:hypothetical protein